MNELQYLFVGFAVFWAGLVAYLVWLQARLRALKQDVQRLEERVREEAEAAALGQPSGRDERPFAGRLAPALNADPEAREAP